MKLRNKKWVLIPAVVLAFFMFAFFSVNGQSENQQPGPGLTGFVKDHQDQPIQGATVSIADTSAANQDTEPDQADGLISAETQADGSFLLNVSEKLSVGQELMVERVHFETVKIPLNGGQVGLLNNGETVYLQDVVLVRQISPAFWIATIVFVVVLVLIALGWLHNTLSALVGAALIFAVSYLGPLFRADLYIFNFNTAMKYIDWNVIFLIMGMMIVIAVVERTGVFQWMALMAYKLSGGRIWLLLTILMVITGVSSAFLDNVTTMLLMTPITVQIALSLGINPLALLVPEVFASNVVGIITLIGTPTNILIGSYARISFADFMRNLSPGVLASLVGLILYSLWVYRKELISNIDLEMADLLMEKLEKQAVINEPGNLKKVGVVGLGMVVLFITGEHMHMLPSVTAIMGAAALLVWIRPNVEEMIESVDWTTLVFFMTLFICVGAIQEVGLISFITYWIVKIVADNLLLAMLAIIWISAILSTVVANIPFTAAMLPVIGYLSKTIPSAHSKVLFYCLSVGSAMGGNGSLIGASANMVTAGIAERAGYPITYTYFLKKGMPALVITVGLATIWLLIRF